MKTARNWTWIIIGTSLVIASRSDQVHGHDSWLIADQDRVEKGATVRFAFVTSENFPKSESAAKPERVASWKVVRRAKREKLADAVVEGSDLVTRKAFDNEGFFLVELALKPNFIELPSKDFEHYLSEEKAEAALAGFKRRSAPDAPARELYTKFSKTWVTVSEPVKDAGFQQVVGHTLEIVPQSDPRAWMAGKEVEVMVMFEGQPLAGARVSSGYEGLAPHAYAQSVETDANGVAHLTLSRGGLWYLRTHVIRALATPRAASNEPDAPKADWESFWASVTFRVAG